MEQRPQVGQAVLHWRAGQRDAGSGGELPDRAALPRRWIPDGLGFVQDHQPPGHLRQPGLPHQHGVRGDDKIGLGQMRLGRGRDVRQTPAIRHRRVQEAQLERRRKARRLVAPVSQERRRNHEKRRCSRPLGAVATLAQQQCQHLDGLPEAHVVGEASAEAQPRQKTQPAQSLVLIGPQRALQGIGDLHRIQSPPVGAGPR